MQTKTMGSMTSDQVEQLMAFLLESAQGSKDFVLDQAPLYAQELVTYSRASSTLAAAASVIVAVSFVALIIWCLLKIKKAGGDLADDECLAPAIGLIFFGSGLAMSGIFVVETASDALKAWTAPRVVIVEHVGGWVR